MLTSRVHELARKPTTTLRAMYIRLAGDSLLKQQAAASWDRDRLITAIRDLEEPRVRREPGGPGGPGGTGPRTGPLAP